MANWYRTASAAQLCPHPDARLIELGGCRRLRFWWDGAAYDHAYQRLFLIEDETGGVHRAHIEWHLGRLLLMRAAQAPFHGLIWICRRTEQERLSDLLLRWSALAPLPSDAGIPMQVHDVNGAVYSSFTWGTGGGKN